MIKHNLKTPLESYESDLKREGFNHDPAQREAVLKTQRLYEDLLNPAVIRPQKDSWIKGIFQKNKITAVEPVKGLYFWGGVGRGKTYIVDTLYNCLPFSQKQRIHFHAFMQAVHHELKSLKNRQDPLQIVADRFSRKSRIICFDEFHVSDITDAMFLGNLLQALFDRGVTLVATSNEHPDELYSGGLQRQRFLPAIELIKQYCEVVNVDGGIDYRYRVLEKAEIYHSPLDDESKESLAKSFSALAPEKGIEHRPIKIECRKIKTIKQADGIVWFNFKDICDGPRGAADYIEIARIFQTVLISDVPAMGSDKDDNARRFMTMIDEFYDRNVKLIISAEVEAEYLYSGSRLTQSFKRTISRLREMGSKQYLLRQHISE